MPQWRGTIAPRQWKKRDGGGREGYLDNRAGDRSTIAAVFSIRHYLIDRVAGLIVRGAISGLPLCEVVPYSPNISSILNSQHPLYSITTYSHFRGLAILYVCAMHMCIHGQRAGLSRGLLFALHQPRENRGQLCKETKGKREKLKAGRWWAMRCKSI